MKLIKTFIFLVLLTFIAGIGFFMIYPDISKLKTENPKKTSFMEYREEEWKKKGKKIRLQKKWVSLSRISPYLMKAVIIAEDDKFWSHKGFDLDAIQKAFCVVVGVNNLPMPHFGDYPVNLVEPVQFGQFLGI